MYSFMQLVPIILLFEVADDAMGNRFDKYIHMVKITMILYMWI